jgi:hypothetical protein
VFRYLVEWILVYCYVRIQRRLSNYRPCTQVSFVFLQSLTTNTSLYQCPNSLMSLLFAFFGSFCPSATCTCLSHLDSADFSTTTVLSLLPASLPAALASLTLCVLLNPVPLLGRSSVAVSNGLNGRSMVIVNARNALRLPRDGNWS